MKEERGPYRQEASERTLQFVQNANYQGCLERIEEVCVLEMKESLESPKTAHIFFTLPI